MPPSRPPQRARQNPEALLHPTMLTTALLLGLIILLVATESDARPAGPTDQSRA